MDNNEIKKANRKALPKFILIMVPQLKIQTVRSHSRLDGLFFSLLFRTFPFLEAAIDLPPVIT